MNTQTSTSNLFVRPPRIFQEEPKPPFVSNDRKNPEFHLSLVVLADLFLLNTVILVFMNWSELPNPSGGGSLFNSLTIFLIVLNLVWFLVILFTNVYRILGGIRLDLKIQNLFWGNLLFFGAIGLIYYQFFFHIFQVHFLIPSLVVFTLLSMLVHLGMRYYYNRVQRWPMSYVIVGGNTGNFEYLRKEFGSIYGNNIYCLGRFGETPIAGVTDLGNYDQIESFIEQHQISKLLYINSSLANKEVQRIIKLCRNFFIEFEVVPKEIEFFQKGIQVEQLAHMPIFCRKKEPLCKLKNKILKRSFDLLFSLVIVMPILIVVWPIIALAIKLESRGPVLFIQERTGYWNKPFRCLKFRTMKVNEHSDVLQATKDDKRITRVGAFLRKTNLDELPQFINVLKGDMSIVGPRPHMLRHTEIYSKLIEQFMIRHEVKPGITGWAQVSGWRGPTKEVNQMEKRVEYDVEYIENWSFWFDCKCILLTVFNMAKGESNAF